MSASGDSRVKRDLERLRRLGIQITRRNAHLQHTQTQEDATTTSSSASGDTQTASLSPLMTQWNRNGDAFIAYIRETKPQRQQEDEHASSSFQHSTRNKHSSTRTTIEPPALVDGDTIAMSLAPPTQPSSSLSASRHVRPSHSSLKLASMRVDTILEWIETHQASQIGLAYWILKSPPSSDDEDDGEVVQFKLIPSFQPMCMDVQGKDARKSAKRVWQAARDVSQLPGTPKIPTNQFGVGLYRPQWQRIKFYWVRYVPQKYSAAYGAQQITVKYVGKSARLYTTDDWIEALSTPFVFHVQ